MAAIQDVTQNGLGAMAKYRDDPEILAVIEELKGMFWVLRSSHNHDERGGWASEAAAGIFREGVFFFFFYCKVGRPATFSEVFKRNG